MPRSVAEYLEHILDEIDYEIVWDVAANKAAQLAPDIQQVLVDERDREND